MKPFKDPAFILLFAAVIAALALEFLSLVGMDIPEPYSPFIFGALILGFGYQVLWNGLKALIKLRFSSINLLMLLAVIAAFYLGEYPEAAVVIVLYVLGEYLEEFGIERSKSTLAGLVSRSPKTAMLRESGQTALIEDVAVGTVIAVRPGELIPLDGRIVSGETTVDEAMITGEPIPKDKHPGDLLFAGTINKESYIEIETTKKSEDSTFARIVRLTFEARANKAPTQQFIQKFSSIYTPVVLVLALLLVLVPVFVFKQDFDHWLLQAVSLLVIACPCALVISTPVAIYAAMGNASAQGILIKGGKYLEAMARLQVLALDKTRTLTYGKPVVSDIIPLNGTSREELLACASGAEVFSEHPLAEAIVEASRREGFEPHSAEAYKSVPGKGATAKCLVCEDETIYVGKLAFIREHQHVSPEAELLVEKLSSEGKTSVVISFGDGVAGIIGLTDELKTDSPQAVSEINALGVETIILSGDNQHAAAFIASQLGITEVYGNLLPEEKAACVEKLLRRYKHVGMVGDGINDAPALARSTVGIAMGAAGSDTAIETANVALMQDKLLQIPFLVRLGRAALRRIRINTIGAIAVKLVFIALAFSGYSQLVLAIAADVGVTLVVILLSLRLMKFR
ncbi:MAG: ATPase [Crocinitomicaceae bacterium]|jgi:Cd2+/Zn2+-exporting ATPase|nr:ATPase [Crocinitomicaceae bacterium]